MKRIKHMNVRDRQVLTNQAGISLIEVMLAIILIVIPTGWMVAGITTAGTAKAKAELRYEAIEAALSMADQIRATPINEVFQSFGPDGTTGDTFSVPGLDGDQPAGSIQIITDETATDAEIGMTLGMPRDLDGDALAESTDISVVGQCASGDHHHPVVVSRSTGTVQDSHRHDALESGRGNTIPIDLRGVARLPGGAFSFVDPDEREFCHAARTVEFSPTPHDEERSSEPPTTNCTSIRVPTQ